jgi:hypothetical protein
MAGSAWASLEEALVIVKAAGAPDPIDELKRRIGEAHLMRPGERPLPAKADTPLRVRIFTERTTVGTDWLVDATLDIPRSTIDCRGYMPRTWEDPSFQTLRCHPEEIKLWRDDLHRLWPAVENLVKPVKPKRGNPGKHDWIEGKAFAHCVMDERGDPTDPDDQVRGWKTVSDLARLIAAHLSKGNPDQEPDLGLTCEKAKTFIDSWRAKQHELIGKD